MKQQKAAGSSAVPPREEAPKDYATVFTNAKAGMASCDRQKIQQVVYDMSKVRWLELFPVADDRVRSPEGESWSQGSAHFKNEERKQEQSNARTQKMLQRKAQLTQAELAGHER